VGGSSLAHEFNLVCSGGTVDSCVPACSAALRGDLLLMNLNGEDSKYSCELHHGLHSWVGAATDGGYLGSDAQAFVSAVLSGAAGYYALALTRDAGVGTDLKIGPGQDVHISGAPGLLNAPRWGSADFIVGSEGSLQLSGVRVSGSVDVKAASTVRFQSVIQSNDRPTFPSMVTFVIANDGHSFTSTPLGQPHWQCQAPYETMNDAWRRATEGRGSCGLSHGCHCDGDGPIQGQAIGASTPSLANRWFRISGAAGNGLVRRPPGGWHCGSEVNGWLSDWNPQSGRAPQTYGQGGVYPGLQDGMKDYTVCFDFAAGAGPCHWSTTVKVLNCGGYYLWRLPSPPEPCGSYASVYCTVP
jgi:hypothetical protein